MRKKKIAHFATRLYDFEENLSRLERDEELMNAKCCLYFQGEPEANDSRVRHFPHSGVICFVAETMAPYTPRYS